MVRPTLLILGFGAVGQLVAVRAQAAGWRVLGVRRSAVAPPPGVSLLQGDAADPELHARIRRGYGRPRALLFSANPGFRSGGDNQLETAAALAVRCWPGTRLVALGSTAVYGDTGGAPLAEDGVLARSERAQRLLAIESALLQAPAALLLRAGALASLARARSSSRLRSGRMQIRGGLQRPLSWIHEDDLAAIAWQGLQGGLGCGVLNATAACWPTVASFHRRLAAELRWPLELEAVPGEAPERRIVAEELLQRGGTAPRCEWWT